MDYWIALVIFGRGFYIGYLWASMFKICNKEPPRRDKEMLVVHRGQGVAKYVAWGSC